MNAPAAFALGILIFFISFSPHISRAAGAKAETTLALPSDLEVVDFVGEPETVKSSTRIRCRVRGPRGGHLMLIEKQPGARAWYDPTNPDTEEEDGFRGDPRWVLEIFGPQLAHYFGFRQLSATQILVPSADEINTALAEYNAKTAPEMRIPLRFYEPDVERVPDEIYIRRLVDKTELPVARNGREALHDVWIHLPAILLPPDLIELGQMRAQLDLDLLAFMRRKVPDLAPFYGSLYSNDAGGIADAQVNLIANAIDHLTAAPTLAFATGLPEYLQSQAAHEKKEPFAFWIERSFRNGKSPLSDLAERFQRHLTKNAPLKPTLELFVRTERTIHPEFEHDLEATADELREETAENLKALREFAGAQIKQACEAWVLN